MEESRIGGLFLFLDILGFYIEPHLQFIFLLNRIVVHQA